MRKLEISALPNILRYEPETGKLYWRERTPDMFKEGSRTSAGNCTIWNARYAGQETFMSRDRHGYKRGCIFKKDRLAHRVIWALVHGEWPPEDIDHINGVRDDNRLENLRAVSRAENHRNKRRQRNNTSGVTGVRWCRRSRKWMACINQGIIGYFTDFSAAVDARKSAEIRHGFHENHGREAA